MNFSRLEKTLNAVLERHVSPANLPSEFWKDSASAKHWLATHVSASQAGLLSVVDELNCCGAFERNEKVFVQYPNGATGLPFSEIAHWLLARAFNTTVDSALNELRAFIEMKPRRMWRVSGLAGIDVSERVELDAGIALCDLDSAPLSPQLEHYTGKQQRSDLPVPVEMSQMRAVLVAEEKISIRLFSEWSDAIKLESAPSRQSMRLHHTGNCLPLFGPNAATACVGWMHYDEPSTIPGFGWFPSAGRPVSEMRADRSFPFVDEPRRAEIIHAYETKISKVESTLTLALSRFSQAMRRQKMEDTAIELRIALEVLLVKDRGDDGPKTHLIRQRGALALAENLEDRKKIAGELAKAYDASSTVIHSGKFKKTNQRKDVETGLVQRNT